MGVFIWPAEDGWPYPDTGHETIDLDSEADDDLLAVRLALGAGHTELLHEGLLSGLSPLEREVVEGRFGLDGTPERTFDELHVHLGVSDDVIRAALGSGLEKIRLHLAE